MNSRKPAYKLVIVESPAKARTISKFLGRSYKVEASQGHVRDLPKSQLGVDVEHNFEPKYITIRGRGEVLERIRKEAKGAKSVILATDPDREGEAISWHLATILGIDPESACRVEFNEITEKTVKSAIKQPAGLPLILPQMNARSLYLAGMLAFACAGSARRLAIAGVLELISLCSYMEAIFNCTIIPMNVLSLMAIACATVILLELLDKLGIKGALSRESNA